MASRSPFHTPRRFTMGALALTLVVGVSCLGTAFAQQTAPSNQTAAPLPPEIASLQSTARYRHAIWGLLVFDRATGTVVHELNGDRMFIPGSTTKIFSTTTALDAYGPDYRFDTPVYRTGSIANGVLAGDLVLVASGDPTMSGRNTPDGHIDFRPIDHINANALGGAELTPEDPVAGLDELARQVAASGVRSVQGNVIIDARLYPTIPKDEFVLSPIMINDNLIDLTISPAAVGKTATVAWRPRSSAYRVESKVKTVAAAEPAEVTTTSPAPGEIVVDGQIPVGKPTVRTFQVTDPSSFARALFIDALKRNGVAVSAATSDRNPSPPAASAYSGERRLALLRSLPFSETIKLVLKVSHNQIADTLIELIALKNGKVGFDEGMHLILPFLRKAGVDDGGVSLGDGRGNARGDVFTPNSVASLLRYMTKQPDFAAFHNGLPVLGVDGTEFEAVPATSPARGKASVKTGAVVTADLVHFKPIQTAASMAGYLTTKSGRELIVALYINNIVLQADDVGEVFAVDHDMGSVFEALYDHD